MRTPVEIWLKDHQSAYGLADRLVELLSPDDIIALLKSISENNLRESVFSTLKEIVDTAEGHFRQEENILVPALEAHFGPDDRTVFDSLGCLKREHEQMHLFIGRIRDVLSTTDPGGPLESTTASELMRLSYGIQSVLRHHCTKEEREVFPLVSKLPMKLVHKLMVQMGTVDDIPLDHLLNNPGRIRTDDDPLAGEGPEN